MLGEASTTPHPHSSSPRTSLTNLSENTSTMPTHLAWPAAWTVLWNYLLPNLSSASVLSILFWQRGGSRQRNLILAYKQTARPEYRKTSLSSKCAPYQGRNMHKHGKQPCVMAEKNPNTYIQKKKKKKKSCTVRTKALCPYCIPQLSGHTSV